MARLASPLLLCPLAGTAVFIVLLLVLGRVPLSYTVRNVTVRWRTTLMTALAFVLVISLFTVMLAFVNGMYRITASSGNPCNVIVLSDGATDEIFSNLSPADIGDLANQPGIVRENGQPLASCETFMIVIQPIAHPQPGRRTRRYLQLRGIDDVLVSARVHGLGLLPGGAWFSDAGVQELPGAGRDARGRPVIEAVLGSGIAREMGRDRTPAELAHARNPQRLDVGDLFSQAERTWLVVGVMDSAGSTFDSEVWCKRSIAAPLYGKNTYTSLIARAADPATARQLREFFTSGYKKAAVQGQVETDYYSSLGGTTQAILYAVVFVAVVMSIGGILGVMNTMFAAISQRIRDIGVMQLIGFGRQQIIIAFLLESLLIALVGGTLGCALGALADGWTATSIVSSGPGSGKFVVLKLTVDPPVLAVGMLLALAMGTIGGLIPPLLEMPKRALDALR